ncbi:MAG: Crp/Fnr family transcriptional regulator [Lachnospiraceae bacterium]|jgi:CRP-like cAMP-binding protein|uniref:Crp/Fnr family transcriptional regulator n=1 Tax=Clostridium sp. (strain SY8519) TaxID=1042156 RepID=UPI00021714A9|nr:Crp/Fnr family transcriptional regulator [Clostridium sp. SY8519]MCI1654941.1 Crp/Fnr family transcriptional regulator [Lachnospiraceae bacterium]MCI1657303.1 Crp/Fnr family transcriptional regulator [Lachnospiraceae bacterium]MCI2195781.1 Crp/Fnr family transcriptional regulator [Lachnospiraceae bacterium]BAK45989.1 hypothetical protein CXIVA_00220 [Clostridium sp. SY8519]
MQQTAIPYTDIPLFSEIRPEDLEVMLHCLKSYRRTFAKGEVVILDQDKVPYFGVVLSGCIHMMKEDIWGGQTLLSYMNPGELLGETFALRKENSSHVSFIAAKNSEILFISSYHILHTCQRGCSFHQQITQNMFDLLGEKNIGLMEKIEITSKPTLREKILAFLSLQAQKQESKYITLPLSRVEMANYLSTNRSSMTRELAAMRDEGILDFDKNTFILKK